MLLARPIPEWPQLAWVARIPSDLSRVEVWHGPRVEARGGYCVEGVWAGDFAAGGFDRTSLLFGSGIRLRDREVICASSGTTLDRLWHVHRENDAIVSNSLPCLLASTGTSLSDEYEKYHSDIATLTGGLSKVKTRLPLACGSVELTYHHNLRFRPGGWVRLPKPPVDATFSDFSAYRGFLWSVAESLAENARTEARTWRYAIVAAISSGYDSPTAAAIAKHAGCDAAVTITRARSLLSISDTGARIAARLGIPCQEVDPKQVRSSHEEWFWAALSEPTDLNLAAFRYPSLPCLLVTGFMGDRIWDRNPHDVRDPFVRGDLAGLGFSEYRLLAGVAHVPVPCWGLDARHAEELQRISASPEMQAWSVGGHYDRPICRRILEEAGVPRGTFALRKKATTLSAERHRRPVTRSARARFEMYARTRGVKLGHYFPEALLSAFDEDVLGRLRNLPGLRRLRMSTGRVAERIAFQWANSEVSSFYRQGLRAAGVDYAL